MVIRIRNIHTTLHVKWPITGPEISPALSLPFTCGVLLGPIALTYPFFPYQQTLLPVVANSWTTQAIIR